MTLFPIDHLTGIKRLPTLQTDVTDARYIRCGGLRTLYKGQGIQYPILILTEGFHKS